MSDEPKRNAQPVDEPPLEFAPFDDAQDRRDERVRPAKNRLLQRSRTPNRKLFDARAKRRFLDVFAATANARMGAEAAGVAYPTVFKHRARDAEFAAAWDEALSVGYARLEAEVLAAALAPSPGLFEDGDAPLGFAPFDAAPFDGAPDRQDRREERESKAGHALPSSTARAVEPSREREGSAAVPPMTVEQKLAILREYRRGFGAGRRAPSARPVVASQEEAIAALAQRLANFAVKGRLAFPTPEVEVGGGSDGGEQRNGGAGD